MRFFAALLLFVCLPINAEPVGQAKSSDGETVTIYSEDCRLPEVTNLKKRAVWTEGDKKYEGCWGSHHQMPLVILYFSDKTVVVIHAQMFERMVGI